MSRLSRVDSEPHVALRRALRFLLVCGLLAGAPSGSHAQPDSVPPSAPASPSARCAASAAPRLEIQGTQFLIDGREAFPVFASYFEVMRADLETVKSDLAYLRSRGFSGVRIFPQWRRPEQDPGDTLLDAAGAIRSQSRWNHFAGVLLEAGSCDLLVDVTFNRESLPGFSVDAYRRGIAEVARRLKGMAPHVLFDLQNERNHPVHEAMAFSTGEVTGLRNGVKAADAGRILMMSTMGEPEESVALALAASLDVVAFHESQSAGWYEHTAERVQSLRRAGRPVYLQEGARAPDRGVSCTASGVSLNPWVRAVQIARKAGAAAWTFHTHAGFDLGLRRFQDAIRACPSESEFVDALPTLRLEP